ncbi:hypothetical protein [Clostridium sp.]|uniref:hypothetical protein n=1 Tax=Clostridium sp. TaxID=1506 RepID=UPI0025BA444F|nr:hypothetical protein [Clostridium sp.]
MILREKDCPFFDDDEIDYYYEKNNYEINATVFQCFIIKAEDTTVALSGLNLQDTSKYFRRLAQNYRPNNSGTLS